jgi:outer membrane protein assembly factor BamB
MWYKLTDRTRRVARLALALALVLLLALGGSIALRAVLTQAADQTGTGNHPATVAPPTATPTAIPTATPLPPPTVPGDWPTYLGTSSHTSYNPDEMTLNPTAAPQIVQPWAGGNGLSITGDFVEANGLVYLGFWNGDLRAWAPTTGKVQWNHNLGQTTIPNCKPNVTGLGNVVGVADTPTTTTLNGTKMLFVGGDAQLYALDALTGNTIWQTRLGSSPTHFLWGSPVYDYATTSVYIGVASFGACPAVQGEVVQLDARTGSILHTFNVVPDACTGGEILGSPTLDPAANMLFVATGDAGSCDSPELYASSLVALNTADLNVVASWQVPDAQAAGGTNGFASTPILFPAPIGHRVHQLVGVANRNGVYYALDHSNLAAGPVWQRTIAVGGRTALQYVPGTASGQGSVAPSSWDGIRLYVAGGQTTIRGGSCKGSVRALSPVDGHVIWEQCMQAGPVVGAPASCAGGVVIAGEGDKVVAMSSSTGAVLYTYLDPEFMPFGSGPAISRGWIYIGNVDGGMHAYRV